MSDITVHKFTLDMLDECTNLYMKTYSQAPWHERWDSSHVVSDFYKNHYANNYFIGFVAMKDEKIVGVSVGFAKPYINGMEYYIDDFFVSTDYHRQGIGSKFMTAIKNELLAQNIHAIMLNTERGYPAHKFYESLGFEASEASVILLSTF
ncbi:MAG: GNAT family N-acetyltransferase [Defluviitaleaceae bacterium]|nr:GNAT family N-acetyltransferase [Defluviitaleaceae bacterium]